MTSNYHYLLKRHSLLQYQSVGSVNNEKKCVHLVGFASSCVCILQSFLLSLYRSYRGCINKHAHTTLYNHNLSHCQNVHSSCTLFFLNKSRTFWRKLVSIQLQSIYHICLKHTTKWVHTICTLYFKFFCVSRLYMTTEDLVCIKKRGIRMSLPCHFVVWQMMVNKNLCITRDFQ